MIHWNDFPSIADHTPNEINSDTRETRHFGYRINDATVFLCENAVKRTRNGELLDLAFRDALDVVDGNDPSAIAPDLRLQWQEETDRLYLYDDMVDFGLWTSTDVAHLFERYISHCHDFDFSGFVAKDKNATIVTPGMSVDAANALKQYGSNVGQDKRSLRIAAARGLVQQHYRRVK